MTKKIYLVPLPKSTTTRPPSNSSRSQIQSAGLIPRAGVATEKIALQNVDVTVRGQFRFGEFSRVLKRELESLGQSDYAAIPFVDDDNPAADDQSGYYEVSDVEVNRAHETSELAHQYVLGLTFTDTRESAWRAVTTTSETVNTGLATGTGGLIAVDSRAVNARWADPTGANTPTGATVQETAETELSAVARYDPTEPTFDDPTLIYDLPLEHEGPADVRLWDTRGLDKYVTYGGDSDTVGSSTVGTATVGDASTVRQWAHAYHPSFAFEGVPLVDNGLLRVRFDPEVLVASEWDDANTQWSAIPIDHGDYTVFDYDIETIGPGMVEVFVEFEDRTDGSLDVAVLSFQRGLSRAVVRDGPNSTVPSKLETMLQPIASDQTTDKRPSQTVVPRSEVK